MSAPGRHVGRSTPSGLFLCWPSVRASWVFGISWVTSTHAGSLVRSPSFSDATDAGFNLLVVLAGALWFLVTIEARLRRKKALDCLEELREFIHVIDVTQLYYTPDLYNADPASSHSSLNLDYNYLLFCTQMLGVISNLAPLYIRGAAGDSILRAVSEVEMLAIAIIAKQLSKAESVREVSTPR